ncbi:MAG: hypothetical protein H6742_20965 [Alphaproteobacteria bacterium]|nr:hypothetical protein [Alphaproteobacteria bacterium]
MIPGLLALWGSLALSGVAAAADPGAAGAAGAEPKVKAEVHGDLKAFSLVTFPYENEVAAAFGFWPEDPTGQAVLDGRLKLRLDLGEDWKLEAHHDIAAVTGSATTLGGTGVAGGAPELVDLTWTVPDDPTGKSTTIQGRTDRLFAQGELGPVTVGIGRQPVSFGAGMFFTPLDLVSPFFPGTIDTEYKPGVDAVRVEAYAGYAFEQRVVAAWVGDCFVTETDNGCEAGVDDLALASWTRVTVGVTDLALFLGEVYDDEVVGVSVVSGVGPVGLHGDASLTLPPGHLDGRDPTEDPFVRAVVGATWRPFATSTLSGEVYVQSNGETDPAQYLVQATNARYTRGELWALGRTYVGLSWAEELRPMISGSLSAIANVEDPSALLIPSVAVSVADNASMSAGAYVGLGARPDGLQFESELGYMPVTGFVSMAMYF